MKAQRRRVYVSAMVAGWATAFIVGHAYGFWWGVLALCSWPIWWGYGLYLWATPILRAKGVL